MIEAASPIPLQKERANQLTGQQGISSRLFSPPFGGVGRGSVFLSKQGGIACDNAERRWWRRWKLAFTRPKAYSRIDAAGIAMLRGVFSFFLHSSNLKIQCSKLLGWYFLHILCIGASALYFPRLSMRARTCEAGIFIWTWWELAHKKVQRNMPQGFEEAVHA